ncbi:MAG: haloacid dehalogenase-like hydrolase [Ruminococcaceae bacterium]|nr:haloacid dehalogenase-like hydrolase [Oscillospiraceae bacterium]
MNCYDFDDTIFTGDSSMCFYRFCLLRHIKILRHLPKQAAAFVRHYVLHTLSKTEMKEIFYRYFQDVPDMENTLSAFWDKNLRRVKNFYLAQQQEEDVIISASPEFFLEPACKRLGIRHLIASPVDPVTGCYAGENCHGEEKVLRFHALFSDVEIDAFYSDSLSDTPMARLAKRAFLVKGEKLCPWPELGR